MPDIEKNGYGVPVQLIQGGCKAMGEVYLSNPAQFSWLYEFEDKNGPQRYVFLAVAGQHPQIGDTIVNGVLVKKTESLINNDPGFQAKDKIEDVWPQDYKG